MKIIFKHTSIASPQCFGIYFQHVRNIGSIPPAKATHTMALIWTAGFVSPIITYDSFFRVSGRREGAPCTFLQPCQNPAIRLGLS